MVFCYHEPRSFQQKSTEKGYMAHNTAKLTPPWEADSRHPCQKKGPPLVKSAHFTIMFTRQSPTSWSQSTTTLLQTQMVNKQSEAFFVPCNLEHLSYKSQESAEIVLTLQPCKSQKSASCRTWPQAFKTLLPETQKKTDRRNKKVSCSTKQIVIRTGITSDDHSTDLLVRAYAE